MRWLRWGRFHWPWGTRLFSAVDHSYDIQTPGFLEILVADSTLTCFCVCIRFSSFPLKWLSSSKMASLRPSIPLLGWWPAWSPCGPRIPASPSLWLVWVGSPFRWHDTCLPLWSLQTRKWTYGTHAPEIFTQHLFLSSLTPGVIDYFDYFWPCPLPVLMAGLGNFICNLFGTPKWQAFYRSLYKIDNFGWK